MLSPSPSPPPARDKLMKSSHTPTKFFGLDLRQLQSDWALALNQAAHWPVLRWLAPAYVTRVRLPNGDTADYSEKTGRAAPAAQRAKTVKFQGFLLPDHLVLWHPMTLPNLKDDAARAALKLQVKSLSPFLADDVIWGHTPLLSVQGGKKTHIAMASRKLTAQYMASFEGAVPKPNDFELWVEVPETHGLLVLNGFGEKKRRQLAARWRAVNLCLVFLLAAIGFAAAITPAVQLRLRAIQAAQDYVNLQTQAAPAVQQRERLVQLDQHIKALQVETKQRLHPELILAKITKLLTDDTYVTSLQMQGDKILLVGQTTNTAALMQQLGAQAGVKDVKAPIATTKQRGADRETFNIEFTLDASSLTAQP